MDPQDLLTLLGLGVAVYTILPPERRLDLQLRLGLVDRALIGAALILVHVFAYQDVLFRVGLPPLFGTWRWGFGPENVSYLVILLTTGVLWLRSRTATISPARMPLLRELTERLLHEQKFADLLFLMDSHLDPLLRAFRRERLLPRLRQLLSPEPRLMMGPDMSSGRILIREEPLDVWRKLSSPLGQILTNGEEAKLAAGDIIRRILLSKPLVDEIAQARPYFGLRVLAQEFDGRDEFLNLFMRALLENPGSVLYFEIRNNQWMDTGSHHRYRLEREHRLLHFFLSDTKVAENLGVYKPIGDFALDELQRRWHDPQHDTLKGPLVDYFEEDRWHSGLHATIRWFDFMVTEALYQGTQWHMWLYYLPPMAEHISRNLKNPHDHVRHDSEWPTPYHYLLYEIVTCLCYWIEDVADVPSVQKNVTLKNDRVDHENDNIPKSAILALGSVFEQVMVSENLSPEFKTYLLEAALRRLKRLKESSADPRYVSLMIRSLAQGGKHGGASHAQYVPELRSAFHGVDLMLKLDDGPSGLGQLIGAT